MNDKVPEIITRTVADIDVGDRIARGFLPGGEPGVVQFVWPYAENGDEWVCVVPIVNGVPRPEAFLADKTVKIEVPGDVTPDAEQMGFGYTRADTEPEQVAAPEGALVVAVGRAAVPRPSDPFADADDVFSLRDGA